MKNSAKPFPPAVELVGPDLDQAPMAWSFRLALLATICATIFLITLGNLTRTSDHAFTCPDWPTCYGQVTLPALQAARIQFIHRSLAALSAALLFISTLLASFYYRNRPWLARPLRVGILLMAAQIGLGGYAALTRTSAALAPLHLGLAMLSLACVLCAAVIAWNKPSRPLPAFRVIWRSSFARLSLWSFAAVFILMINGTILAGDASANACPGWPLCGGGLPASLPGWLQLGHRALSALVGMVVVVMFLHAWAGQRSRRTILTSATAVLVLLCGQGLVGALKVSRGFPPDLVGLHAASAAALWAAQAVVTVSAGLAAASPVETAIKAETPLAIWRRAGDFFTLNKPLLVALLLFTTYAGMVVGGKSLPALALTLWTMLGGALSAGGASAINQYIDRDLDRAMKRTGNRPLPAGRLTSAEGLAFGIGACLAGFFILTGFVNLLAALLALAGMVYYTLIYSVWLKRLSVQNIVIGAGAGAIPPLVGWAAAAGHLQWNALFLFAVIFLWSPPHFWSLALVRREEYAFAGIPMLPVVRGEKNTAVQIFIYTLALVAVTLAMPLARLGGSLFFAGAAVCGGLMLFFSTKLLVRGGNRNAWRLYRFSNLYLGLLFLALILDIVL